MKKFTNIGLSAIVAFAMMFAISMASEQKSNSTTLLLDPMWFSVDITGAVDSENPTEQEQIVDNDGNQTPICDGDGELCEVRLDVTNLLALDPDYEFEGKSIADLLAAGASYPSGDRYTHKQ